MQVCNDENTALSPNMSVTLPALGLTVILTSSVTPTAKLGQFIFLTFKVSVDKLPDTFIPSTSKSEEIFPDVAFIFPDIFALVASIEPSDNILKLPLAVTIPSKVI